MGNLDTLESTIVIEKLSKLVKILVNQCYSPCHWCRVHGNLHPTVQLLGPRGRRAHALGLVCSWPPSQCPCKIFYLFFFWVIWTFEMLLPSLSFAPNWLNIFLCGISVPTVTLSNENTHLWWNPLYPPQRLDEAPFSRHLCLQMKHSYASEFYLKTSDYSNSAMV